MVDGFNGKKLMNIKGLKERALMGLEEYEGFISGFGSKLVYFDCVKKFRSVKRAIRRFHVNERGIINPKRPFNNRRNSCKRKNKSSVEMNDVKKNIYSQFKNRIYVG